MYKPKSWRDVLDAKGCGMIDTFRQKAEQAGYSFFCFNDRVYETHNVKKGPIMHVRELGLVTCPRCGEPGFSSEETTELFAYGAPPNTVTLEAKVRVYSCSRCEDEFTDHTAAAARDEAVRQYLRS